MEVSIAEHAALLAYSVVVGLLLGALYDLFRLTRTFLGIGIDYREKKLLSELSPPIIGKREQRRGHALGRAAGYAAVFVFDIVYMAAATAVTVIFVYHAHSGTPRGFALIGEAAGFFVYMKTAGKLTSELAAYIFFLVDTAVRYVIFFTVTPIRALLVRAARLAARLYKVTVLKACRRAEKKRSDRRTSQYINKELQKTLSAIADAVAGGADTEIKDV